MFQESNLEPRAPESTGRWAAVAAAFVVVVAMAFGWSVHERTVARQAALQRDQVTAQLHETEGQISAITDKLNQLTATEQARQQEQQQAAARRAAEQKTSSRRSIFARRRIEETNEQRWKDVNSKLDAENQRLDAANQAISKTQQDLESARTELSGSIARTHGELVLLEKKGERNYYEFDLTKSKQFQHTGPVGISLRKANTKHAYADLDLMVEDTKLQQKHVNLYQPVLFYPPDAATPMELVINQVTKNHIHGYVSAPKYRQSELKAEADSANQSDATTQAANTSGLRKRLAQPE
jgi:hypothetical protein